MPMLTKVGLQIVLLEMEIPLNFSEHVIFFFYFNENIKKKKKMMNKKMFCLLSKKNTLLKQVEALRRRFQFPGCV